MRRLDILMCVLIVFAVNIQRTDNLKMKVGVLACNPDTLKFTEAGPGCRALLGGKAEVRDFGVDQVYAWDLRNHSCFSLRATNDSTLVRVRMTLLRGFRTGKSKSCLYNHRLQVFNQNGTLRTEVRKQFRRSFYQSKLPKGTTKVILRFTCWKKEFVECESQDSCFALEYVKLYGAAGSTHRPLKKLRKAMERAPRMWSRTTPRTLFSDENMKWVIYCMMAAAAALSVVLLVCACVLCCCTVGVRQKNERPFVKNKPASQEAGVAPSRRSGSSTPAKMNLSKRGSSVRGDSLIAISGSKTDRSRSVGVARGDTRSAVAKDGSGKFVATDSGKSVGRDAGGPVVAKDDRGFKSPGLKKNIRRIFGKCPDEKNDPNVEGKDSGSAAATGSDKFASSSSGSRAGGSGVRKENSKLKDGDSRPANTEWVTAFTIGERFVCNKQSQTYLNEMKKEESRDRKQAKVKQEGSSIKKIC